MDIVMYGAAIEARKVNKAVKEIFPRKACLVFSCD